MRLYRRLSRRRRGALTAVVALLLLALLMIAWSLIEPRLLFVNHSVVSSPQVPAGFDGARIVFVTDIHSGSLLGEGRMSRVLDDVLRQEPDLILVGGDNVGGGEDGCEMFYPAAARLKAPLGVIGVLGNHERECGARFSREELDRAGILVLDNASARVRRDGDIVRIAGVEDLLTGRPDVAAAAADISPKEFAILVSHNPDVLPEGLPATRGAFDLALAGHTHGGQMTVFGLWAPVTNSVYGQRFRGGWSEIDGVPVLVSRGAGVFYLPMRFFAFPEIHVIELRRGPKGVRR